MEVDLYQLTEEVEAFDFKLLQDSFKKIDSEFQIEKGIQCHLKVNRIEDKVLIRGYYDVDLSASCHFCLDEVSMRLEGEIDLVLVPENQQENLEEQEFSLSDQDMDYYAGTKIDLGYYMEDQILLDIPVTIKCKADCKGMCSNCGVNRNSQSCECEKINPNSPFAVLKELTDKAD